MNEQDIAAEIAETLSWDIDATLREVKSEAANPGIHARNAWLQANPTSDDQIERFYSDSQSYVYELMREATSDARQDWRTAVIVPSMSNGAELKRHVYWTMVPG